MTETYYRMNAQDVRLAGDIMIMARSFGAVGSATMALQLRSRFCAPVAYGL